MSHDATTRITYAKDQPGLPEEGALVLIYGDELGKRFPIEPELSIGRALSNSIVLDADSISRRHALVYRRKNRYFVEDQGSTNGTLVGDEAIEGATELAHGDLITIGSVVFRFISGSDAESRYHEEIYRLTIVDGLTQVPNRRYLMDFLEREVSRFGRTQSPLSLILFDIDGFKGLNDTHGHLTGDRILKEVARIAAPMARREQLVARYGGDEFVVVLTDTALDGALEVGEKLRAAVEAKEFLTDRGESLTVSISAGAAELESGMTPDDLLQRADEGLYEAKREGRNCVQSAPAR